MARMVRERAISPVELVEAHLRQIDRLNPRLNAFVVVTADRARADARKAEAAVMRGERLGLLHGVPVTVLVTVALRDGLGGPHSMRARARGFPHAPRGLSP